MPDNPRFLSSGGTKGRITFSRNCRSAFRRPVTERSGPAGFGATMSRLAAPRIWSYRILPNRHQNTGASPSFCIDSKNRVSCSATDTELIKTPTSMFRCCAASVKLAEEMNTERPSITTHLACMRVCHHRCPTNVDRRRALVETDPEAVVEYGNGSAKRRTRSELVEVSPAGRWMSTNTRTRN